MIRTRSIISLVLALLLSGLVIHIGINGFGPLPPLGTAFSPTRGVYTMASTALRPHTQTLTVPGLTSSVEIRYNAQGTTYIEAKTDHDLFLTIGYLQARNRLFQMDLMRRQGEGLLSQVIGPAALSSDRFELQLGLLRTARANWVHLNSSSRSALLAYSVGVNDVIRSDEQHGTLPAMFKLLGYRPALWTPIDSLVIQGDMTQDLDYTTAPIEYGILAKSLTYTRTMQYFPVSEPNVQHPYDLGPYTKTSLAPMESQTLSQTTYDLTGGVPDNALPGQARSLAGEASASLNDAHAATIALKDLADVTNSFHHSFSDSNNWAVSGSKTANGQAMMAGDPHLNQTLPSIWYQIAGTAPNFHFSGVSIPGLPMILIGHNANIAWSLTNVQNQATLFYRETINPRNKRQYKYMGSWRAMKEVHYLIPVKGHLPIPLTVQMTVDGPLMTQSSKTYAVDWMGALPSADVESMLDIIQSQNYAAFKKALALWHAPSQNFIYADRYDHIGLISAGYYPEVAHGHPWMPLSGDGSDAIIGTIPYSAVPQSYDPPSGLLFSANQREVTNGYPYYIGTTMDFFSTGFRADKIYQTLKSAKHITPVFFQHLENNTQDVLATQMVPELLKALQHATLSPEEKAAVAQLARFHGNMTVQSQGATIWWFFINQYMKSTFGPWWKADHVPVNIDPNLVLNTTTEVGNPLVDDLEAWTANDPENPAFSLPNGTRRTAQQVMVSALRNTVTLLQHRLGKNPQDWQWGRVHFRHFPSLAQVAALGYGPRPSSGDSWTVDAADGGLVSEAGPSWRMIVSWQGAKAPPFAESVYPGGQSENPLSPWYQDQIPDWWNGRYYAMTPITRIIANRHLVRWTLVP